MAPQGSLLDRIKGTVARLRARYAPFDIGISAFKEFSEDDGGTYAAALTYYTFFSIFPLLLFSASILGYLTFGNDELRQRIFDAGVDSFPMIRDILTPDALGRIEERRQELAASGLALALYSGTGVVVASQHALNKILDFQGEERNWIQKRLRAVLWLLILGAGAVVSMAFGAAANFSAGLFGLGDESIVARALGHGGGFVIGVAVFALAYKFLPRVQQTWRAVLPGAVLAGLLFEILKIGGALYLEAGSKSRAASFGTLTTAAGLLVASFLISQITLLCAELNNVLAKRKKGHNQGQSDDRGGHVEPDTKTGDLYTTNGSGKSAGALVKEISEDLSTLIRKEVELAKIELGESISAKVKGAAIIAIAATLGFFALIFVLLALRDGLDNFLWTWAADLVTAVILLAVGALGALAARKKLATPMSPDLTKQTIKDDVEWAKTITKR